jgi:hypothetical protein
MSYLYNKTSRGGATSSRGATTSSNRSGVRLDPIAPQRQPTPKLSEDVLCDEEAALYVALFKHNIAKAQREVHLQHIKAVALDAVDQIGVETVLLDEERKRLRILVSIAGSLKQEFDERETRVEQLRNILDSTDFTTKDPVVRVVREGLMKRQHEHDSIQLEIKKKQQALLLKQQELAAIRSTVKATEDQAALHAARTQRQQTTTLSEFLGLQGAGEPSKAHKKTQRGHGTPPISDRDEWLKALRIRRGDNMFEIFKESHANPLTMLLSPKANFGHRREEAKRTLETMTHLSPVKGSMESFNGALENALYDVEEVAAVSSSLVAKIALQKEQVEHHMIVLRDPLRLRALDTFQKYEDPRGTFAYVATTPVDVLQRQRLQFLQMFES